MGESISLKCAKCGYVKSFQLGIGMMYSPSGVFESSHGSKPLLESLVRSRKIKERTFSLLNEPSASPADDYGHEIYYCPHCHELHERFYFRIDYNGGCFEPEYQCTKCRHSLHRAKAQTEGGEIRLRYANNKSIDWQCPRCGHGRLEHDIGAFFATWD